MVRSARQFCIASLAAFALCCCVQVSRAQDWPQWRGANRDGVVKDFVAPAAWPEKLKQIWKTPVGTGYSSPVVGQGRAWIHTRSNDEEAVTCLDVKTGKVLWRKTEAVAFTKNQYATQMSNGPFATPALANGRLYTLGVNAVLSCFDAQTGRLEWRKEFGKPDTSKLFCGTAASPLIDGGNVIVYVGDDVKGGQMLALDAASGKERWKWAGDGPGYASPIVAEIEGVQQVVTMTAKSVVGVAAKDGQQLWTLPWPDEWNENIVTPLVYKNSLILSGVRKGTAAVRITKAGDKWEPKELWRNAELTMYMNSPVLDGDHLFGMTNKRKGQLFCADAATGKLLWTTEGREGVNAAILNTKDLLFILTSDASLIIARKSTKGFEQAAKYPVANSATFAHPALIGKQILVKDESSVSLFSLE
jgi:outer membrane protein assembly factor BamB